MKAETNQAVQANDFKRQWQCVREDALAAVERVGESGWLILGAEVQAFERDFAQWWGIDHAVGVASGLDALEIALRCVGIRSGDKVLTTPLTAFATTLAVVRAGGEPVWVDVDETGSLDLELAHVALLADPTIRFVMPVHLYGHPLDPSRLAELAEIHGVTVIEDCAQSAGAERGGRPTGLVGRASGVSLYPTKNLGAMGDGGVVITTDPTIAEQARKLRDYGQRRRYEHSELGLNSRLDELHAAVLRSALLPRLDQWLVRRREITGRYVAGLETVADALRPVVAADGRSANHLFPVEIVDADPEAFGESVRAAGIGVGRHYPILCPDQPAVSGIGRTIGELRVARRLAQRELSLPINPFLTDPEVDRVIAACLEALA